MSWSDRWIAEGKDLGMRSEIDNQAAKIAELEAQLAAVRKDAAWQPIETAPNNSISRLYRVNGYCVQGFFDVTGIPCVQSDGQPWRKMKGKPTHWMPLPKPPTAGEAT